MGWPDFNLRSEGAERIKNCADVSSLRKRADVMAVSRNSKGTHQVQFPVLCISQKAISSHSLLLSLAYNEDAIAEKKICIPSIQLHVNPKSV